MLRLWQRKGSKNELYGEFHLNLCLGRFDNISPRYDVSFVGMIIPGDTLTVNLKHVGMKDGNLVIKAMH